MKNSGKQTFVSLIVTACFGATAALAGWSSATLEAQESFEGTTGYTLTTAFDDGFFDFFGQYAVPDVSNSARDDFTSGFDGSFAIMSQDNDGDGGLATVSIDIDPVNVAGLTDLGITVALGAIDSEPNFNNYEAADNDGIEIYADLGSGAFLIGAFRPNATGSSDLYQDTNLDGVGNGPNLTIALADFQLPITGVGSTLALRIDLTSTSSFEVLAVDNVQVYSSVPEPGSLALIGLGAGLVAFLRRRSH